LSDKLLRRNFFSALLKTFLDDASLISRALNSFQALGNDMSEHLEDVNLEKDPTH
jgi:hypothetical protein